MHSKNMAKKIFAGMTMLLVMTLLSGGLLTGCKKSGSVDVITGSDSSKISFSWWGNDARHAYTMDGVDEFQKQNPDIDVEYHYGDWNGYEKRMQVWMKSHTETDVMQINYAWLDTYSRDGSGYYDLYQLKDYIDLDNFTKEDLAFGEKNGKLNAIPIAFNTSTVYYNKKIYDAYGISLPESWDDYFKAAKMMKKDGIYPIGMAKKQMFLFLIAYYEQTTGKKMFGEDGRFLPGEKDVKTILSFYKRLIDEKVMPSVDQFSDTMFVSGKIAGGMFWVSDAGNCCGGLKAAGGEPVIGEYPDVPGQKLTGWYVKPATMYAVSSRTNHPEEAARLLNYLLNSKEMVRLQGTEKGVPVSRKAVRILHQENAIQSYEAAGNNKMIKERKYMKVLQPVMENDDVLNIFKKNADKYIYGVKDIDFVAKKLYREMCVYNTKEDDSK